MPLELDEIEPARFYQIDPDKLDPKHPDQLKKIRILMVSWKTESSITMKYPSVSSLRSHFNYGQNTRRKTEFPALDETYEMDVGVAREVFVKRLQRFEDIKEAFLISWLSIKNGPCWSGLKSSDMVHWAFLRKRSGRDNTKNKKARSDDLRRNMKNSRSRWSEDRYKGAFSSSWLSIKNGPCWSGLKSNDMVHWVSGRRRKDEDDRMDLEIEGGGGGDEVSERGLLSQKKRKRNGYDNMKNKKSRSDDPRRNQATNGGKTTKNMKNSRSRWPEDRYKSAEQNMLNIMKEKGAVFSKPILRAELRAEARKKIGDTGLLDHLLKYMAEKLAPGGEERFQRWYNADGAMEYWLESADLMNIRKEAGVQDPYWIPPPGWQPGDNPSQDPVCAREIKDLRKRVDKLERLVKELISKKQEDHRG